MRSPGRFASAVLGLVASASLLGPKAVEAAISDGPGVLSPTVITVTEAIVVGETPALLGAVLITVNEAISVSDGPGVLSPTVITVTEAIVVGEAPALLGAALITVNEAISVSDGPGVLSPTVITVTEAIVVNETSALLGTTLITVNEAIGVSDAPAVLGPATIMVAEAIVVNETSALLGAALITVNEAIGVSDAPVVLGPAIIEVAESIIVSDGPALLLATLITVNEVIAISDAPGVLLPAVIAVTELIRVSDVSSSGLLPGMAVNDATVARGNVGTTEAVFTVSLSRPAGSPVTVKFDTADITAKAGSHYVARAGTLTFNPGETSKRISIEIRGQSQAEPSRTFAVSLANPTNASISRGRGTGTIVGNDMADLSVTQHVSPKPAVVGKRMTYTLAVKNKGPGRATEVKVTDVFTAGATYLSGMSSLNTCTTVGSTVTCNLGKLEMGATARATINVIPRKTGTITNTASVKGTEADPNPADNIVTASTLIQGTASVPADASISPYIDVPAQTGIPVIAVTNRTSNTVSLIDARTNQVVRIVQLVRTPAAVLFSSHFLYGFAPPAKLFIAQRGNVDGRDAAHSEDDGGKGPGTVQVLFGLTTPTLANALDFTPSTTIRVGDAPEGLAIKPDGTQLWVTNRDGDSISIVERATDSVIAILPLKSTGSSIVTGTEKTTIGQKPVAIDFSPDGHFAYVIGRSSNRFIVLDTRKTVSDPANATLASIEVGNEPVALAVDPRAHQVYVVNRLGNSVAVVDVSIPGAPVLRTRIALGGEPEGIALLADGSKLYVTNRASDTVSVFRLQPGPTFLSLVATIPVGPKPAGIAVTRPGSFPGGYLVYVANREENTVSVIDAASDQEIATIPVGMGPQGVAAGLLPGAP